MVSSCTRITASRGKLTQKALRKLDEPLVLLIPCSQENLFHQRPQLAFAPWIPGSQLGASGVTIVRRFQQRPGGGLVIAGVVPFRQHEPAFGIAGVFFYECSGHERAGGHRWAHGGAEGRRGAQKCAAER